MALNPTHLLSFLHVAQLGSVSKAAVLLNLSQPAISRQIRKLEEELGSTLMVRHGRGIVLTEAGSLVHEHSRGILSQISNIRGELAAMKTTPTGRVSMGFPFTVGPHLVPVLLKTCRERFPGVSLRVHGANSNTLLEWLVSGRIDFAVLHLMKPLRTLVMEPLLEESMYLMGSPDAPFFQHETVAMEDLASIALYLPDPSNELRKLLDNAAHDAGVKLQVPVEMDSVETMKAMAKVGGFTILPLAAAREEIKASAIAAARIVRPSPRRVLVLATTLFQPLSIATRAMAEFTRRAVKQMVLSGEWAGVVQNESLPISSE